MLFSLSELLDILIAVVAGGFIFMDSFRDPRDHAKTFAERLLFSIAIAAPAIVLHELGHKFVALALGYTAVFHAAYVWLGIGVLLKLVGFPFLIVVPAYVSTLGASGLDRALIAAAGPLVNCALWLGSALALKLVTKPSRTLEAVLFYSKTINMFLFIFNFIPIPGFDGYQVFSSLFSL
jgi:Zn-dependent protease